MRQIFHFIFAFTYIHLHLHLHLHPHQLKILITFGQDPGEGGGMVLMRKQVVWWIFDPAFYTSWIIQSQRPWEVR